MRAGAQQADRFAVDCPACGAGIGRRCTNRIAGRPFLRVDQVHESRRRQAVGLAVAR
ncbi:zinc finger domain-containing protein [Actinoplanes ianthinogenes]|uniref:zinc finger domain-containing protein n=1 Tax=Actinoplanes ianthinogenes TaxID=122358 RepID=UPI003F686115